MNSAALELWGGIEATYNRVGSTCLDQLALTGHDHRPSDINLFSSLGIKAIRYPVLWERIAPDGLEAADWSWPDERLNMLRGHGINPVIGLLHHGNGPSSTSLLDPLFPGKFAAYARAVAERYPWVTHYTPINEPMTTARFSGLYGHWYPHARDENVFVQLLFSQCKAIILAMKAIREINPSAQLVQTEDIGHTSSTSALKYQADYENERRWLSLDLLTGGLLRGTSMREHLRHIGIHDAELDCFEENSSMPDLIGIDYYVTSDRYLDDDWALYPAHAHGGNGRHDYADVEAVRAAPEGIRGIRRVIHDVWRRYRLPIAVTEAHIASDVEHQIRWIAEVWNGTKQAQSEGVDVRSVTVWALLGAFDWDSLVTIPRGHYEAGAFDVSRGGAPHHTALVPFLRQLARTGIADHAALDSAGWWSESSRLLTLMST